MPSTLRSTQRCIVSACLAGLATRYDGQSTSHPAVLELVRRGLALPVCPEQLGGLPTPRPACERRGESVFTSDGEDVTHAFRDGARQCLELARLFGAGKAVLKARSPSCGLGQIFDGAFSGRLVRGHGVLAEMLLDAGLTVLTEEDLDLP